MFPVQKRVNIVVISLSFNFMESFSQLCLVNLEKNDKKGKISGFKLVEIIKTKTKQSFLWPRHQFGVSWCFPKKFDVSDDSEQ